MAKSESQNHHQQHLDLNSRFGMQPANFGDTFPLQITAKSLQDLSLKIHFTAFEKKYAELVLEADGFEDDPPNQNA